MKKMKLILLGITLISLTVLSGCTSVNEGRFTIPSEFEEQDYIWLSWYETGFFGGEPFRTTIVNAIREIHPYVKVKIFYGPQLNLSKDQIKAVIYQELRRNEIDSSRVELFYNEKPFGAIQDPGPIFLRNKKAELAVADFRYRHPDKRSEIIDQHVAQEMEIPFISSEMVSEGGAWQTDGEGTMLLVEAVETDRNRKMSKKEIEAEYKRVLGVKKIIWLKKGLKEEEWGKFDNGKYGIGTSGHIDEFCRFVKPGVVLLARVSEKDTVHNEILKESFNRMEENYLILKQSTTADGKPIEIIRIPTGPEIIKKISYKSLSADEHSWFSDVTTDSVEFYLTTGYMNFIIANKMIVTAKYWKEGLPDSFRERDEQAKAILEKAFPGRKIAQIDCMPLHHDGAGLHCHSRNQPKSGFIQKKKN